MRAIAVILVIICHWIPQKNIINILPNGALGVDFFFVLSGFLISRILFENRTCAELSNGSKLEILRNFYVRRALRIFPIYYVTIFILLAFGDKTDTKIEDNFFYYAGYISNFYFFNVQSWDGMLSHLWSLAVEEQFYLIWPFVIIFFNKKYLLFAISLFIIIGSVSQHLLTKVPYGSILTISCFDAFGFGALLALVISYAKDRLNYFYKYLSIIALLAFFLFIVGVFYYWVLPQRTVISIISVWLIT